MSSVVSGLLAINGSPSASSKTHSVAARAVELAGSGRVVDLADLDAEALLGRRSSPDVDDVIEEIRATPVLLVATPIYRATFSGLLKVLFDQLGQGALRETVCILAATGGSDHHFLAVDTGLRPLVASLNGMSVPTALYFTGQHFNEDGTLADEADELLRTALGEAAALAFALKAE
ncbi:MAG TPA: NAD(P)H-dependent oxidoreductase [Acidimicrobiales bacterium]